MSNVLVLGGAGFIGAHIVRRFISEGDKVTIVDGMLPKTGANINNVPKNVEFIDRRIEDVDNLAKMLEKYDVVIDSMAWTSHLEALEDPMYDVDLNIKSHIVLLQNVKRGSKTRFFYLGSRGQYGKDALEPITEQTGMRPDDIQGIDKTAADHFFRVFARLKNLNVTTLRFPNCFGAFQKVEQKDIGLIGGFIKQVIMGLPVEVYGNKRYRSIIYAPDLAGIVWQLSQKKECGYQEYNIAGIRLEIMDIVKEIIRVNGAGKCIQKELPSHIKKIDMGDVLVDDRKLREQLSTLQYTEVPKALAETVNYFKRSLKL